MPTTWGADWDNFGAANHTVIALNPSSYCIHEVLIVTNLAIVIEYKLWKFRIWKVNQIFSRALWILLKFSNSQKHRKEKSITIQDLKYQVRKGILYRVFIIN